jgi:hypothetical protein
MASTAAFKKLLKPKTKGQEKIETPLRHQRGYAKGQVKGAAAAGAATALTAAVVGKMSLDEMRERLKTEKDKANRAILREGIAKALLEVAESDSKKSTVKPKPRPQQKKRGGMIRTGHTDMRKGGLFYK